VLTLPATISLGLPGAFVFGCAFTNTAARTCPGDIIMESIVDDEANVGDEPLPFVLYCSICKWLLEKRDENSIFAHCFLTLTWNLMCRSVNTTLVQKEHMSWEGNAVRIQFAHSKTDITHQEAQHVQHIYQNPLNPDICPLLSIERYMHMFPGRDTGPLFPGDSQCYRFQNILQDIVNEHRAEILAMGIDPDDIGGVHSIRKHSVPAG